MTRKSSKVSIVETDSLERPSVTNAPPAQRTGTSELSSDDDMNLVDEHGPTTQEHEAGATSVAARMKKLHNVNA